MSEEEAPPTEEGANANLLTPEIIAANLSLLEEVEKRRDEGKGRGFAFTKCDLATTACELEAATEAFEDFAHLRYLSLASCKLASCKLVR